VNRQISRVAVFALVLLAALIVATTYWQTWAAGGLADRQDNAFEQVKQFKVRRGVISTCCPRTVLATNRAKKVGGQTLYFRRYPKPGFAAQVVGYSTQSRARAGIEQEENAYLTASNKNVGTLLDRLGDQFSGATVRGNNLVLTLRVKPQELAQRLLQGKCGAAVALNPRTGAVYVMASSPTYDPNLIEKPSGFARIQGTRFPCGSESAPLLNRATQGLYPPGSTFKVVTATAALESHKYGPNSSFYDPGYCEEYGKRVYNAGNADANGPEQFGRLNLVTAFEHSVNAVFCNIGKALGAEAVLDQAKKFGFYAAPPLETPSDTRDPSGLYTGRPGKLTDPKDPSEVDPGRLAFGQANLLVTPLQMAMVAAAIANDGKVMKPHVLKEVRSPGGSVVSRVGPQELSRAASPATAHAVRDMMVAVVESGTGQNAQIPGVEVAGKTGTAETGADRVYHAWFVFFAPAENPVIAGAVVVERQPNGFGGAVAAPIAKAIMQAILPSASNAKP
jgi:peptidoglycan glycosyltransferase